MRHSKTFTSRLAAIALAGTALTPALAYAQDAPTTADPEGQIVVTGSRGQPRTVQNSPVPIDSIGQKELQSVASSDTQDVLKALIPSYAVNRAPNSDGNTFVRAATLRGLPGEDALILLNSKRLHKSSVMTTGGYGSQAADVSTIPALALKTVEVLRDGAAAQYGSDAIAGVINFLLKDEDHGASFVAEGGQFYKGDGDHLLLSGNVGAKIGDRGFINVTAEYTSDGRTTRSNQFCNVSFCATTYAATHPAYAALVDLSKPIQRWGQPTSEAFRAVVNMGYHLTDNTQLYAFGNFSKSTTTNDFHYRYPGNGQAVEDVPVRLADGTAFRFNSLYPAGFVPQFTGKVTDYSVAAGYKGDMKGFADGVHFDLSGHYGRNQIEYLLTNTINASLGPSSPNVFHPGQLVSDELAFNGDFSYDLPVSLFSSPLSLSAGGEYRDEGYKIVAGDKDSYTAGTYATPDPYGFCSNGVATARGATVAGLNCASSTDPVYNTLAAGSNGFAGFTPATAGSWHRRSVSLYGEASTDITSAWFADAAVRFEHYSDFGSTVNGKFATRIKLTDAIALRGSVGSGFRAPSTGQLYYSSVSVTNVNGNVLQQAQVPATNPVAQYLGAKALKPEKSLNVSGGITAHLLPGLDLTADAYLIHITDQIYSTASISVTSAIRAQMVAAGIVGASDISSIRFYQNAFDSTTKGLDIVATYHKRWTNGGDTSFMSSFNLNGYTVGKIKIANLLSNATIFNFQNFNPAFRGVVQMTHTKGKLSGMVRANIYGPYQAQLDSASAGYPIQKFHSEVQVDMEIGYQATKWAKLAVGARNIFNNYPQPDTIGAAVNGAIYRADSIVDWQGGLYYGRVTFNF